MASETADAASERARLGARSRAREGGPAFRPRVPGAAVGASEGAGWIVDESETSDPASDGT